MKINKEKWKVHPVTFLVGFPRWLVIIIIITTAAMAGLIYPEDKNWGIMYLSIMSCMMITLLVSGLKFRPDTWG